MPIYRFNIILLLCFFWCFTIGNNAYAQSTNIRGNIGLNTVPSARIEDVGTMRLGAGTSDPYFHSFLGFQIAEPLYINFRQTGEFSSIKDGATKLYPGIDFKYQLWEEQRARPALAFGINSTMGSKKQASEYFVLSKRFNSFDLTLGTAWGRLAGKGHLKNPLSVVSSHFKNDRNFNSDDSQRIDDWFTGDEIGFFGGVEYNTPFKGLSLKADIGGYDYGTEARSIAGFDAPSPFSFGANYTPSWKGYAPASLSAGLIGTDKVFARLSFQGNIKNWPFKKESKNYNDVSTNSEYLKFLVKNKGLTGPEITLPKNALKKSPEETWHLASFKEPKIKFLSFTDYFSMNIKEKTTQTSIFENQISLAEEDSGVLFRSAFIFDFEHLLPYGFNTGFSTRLNVADNLPFKTFSSKGRQDEAFFANIPLAIDKAYISWLRSFSQHTHFHAAVGYLEEMYAGAGAEILHRPFSKRYAIGADAWQVKKRNPHNGINTQLQEGSQFTGHLNFHYELPDEKTTLFTKVGQYLDEDFGATLGVSNNFKNGAQLNAFVTATNDDDISIFGGKTNLYGGVKLTLPIGRVNLLGNDVELSLKTAPFARRTGQSLNKPNDLYEITEPIAYRHLSQNWSNLLN